MKTAANRPASKSGSDPYQKEKNLKGVNEIKLRGVASSERPLCNLHLTTNYNELKQLVSEGMSEEQALSKLEISLSSSPL